MSFTDPPELPNDELQARVTARQVQETVHIGTFVLLGAGLLAAIAVAAMLVVAW